ncbi:Bacterial protein of unknown function (DUF924) domain containing protein [Rhypophila decipiens]
MGGGPYFPSELGQLLTPELFSCLVQARMPYPKYGSINFSHFGRDIFLEDPVGPQVRDKVLPALVALSKIGLEHMPDLTTAYLPPPTDDAFPEQCLGLLLLLDHFPRLLLRGMDARWTYAYFGVISLDVARKWISLPADQRPDSWERWQRSPAGSVGLDYWIGVRFWFGTPFVHSEELQDIAVKFTDETRRRVEQVTGKKDPYREKRDEIFSDIYGFPREYRNGPPQGDDVTRESWTFWMGMLMDIHKPIIDSFGRYPYLNAVLGRQSSDEEKAYVEKTGHFGEVGPDVAKRILDDIKNGRWTRLGDGQA